MAKFKKTSKSNNRIIMMPNVWKALSIHRALISKSFPLPWKPDFYLPICAPPITAFCPCKAPHLRKQEDG